MKEFVVRPIGRDDFGAVMRLEEEVFAGDGEATLGAYYVRLCCDFLGETCFVATDGGEVVGYVLCFVQGRKAWCTTLAVAPSHRRTRVAWSLIAALVEALVPRVDSCWFTAKVDNRAARAIHRGLGAREVETRHGFYGPGDDRIVSCIETEGLRRAAWRYARLGARLASVDEAEEVAA